MNEIKFQIELVMVEGVVKGFFNYLEILKISPNRIRDYDEKCGQYLCSHSHCIQDSKYVAIMKNNIYN